MGMASSRCVELVIVMVVYRRDFNREREGGELK